MFVALLGMSVAACTSASAAQTQPAASGQGTITVVGEGKVNVKPDIATINIGAEARASSVSEAKAAVDAQMAAITDALEAAEIADEDIQTSHYGIYFEREPAPMPRDGMSAEVPGAYVVSNIVRVTVRDVERAGEVLDAVVQAGANQVHGVTFTVADESAWQSRARADAMADAQSRAQELAGLAGVELGQVLTVSEVIGGAAMPVAFDRGVGGGGIAPGELELGTQIQVTFAIQ
jgi:uncharacterized protein YggE